MWNKKKLSVVMPAYNEEDGVGVIVKEFLSLKEVDEVVVVDNNSTDKTAKHAKNAGARVVKESKQGYGYACMRGLKEGKGEYIILVEPDYTFDPNDIYKFLAFAEEFDIVKGGRSNKYMIADGADWGPFLKYGNWFISKIIQILYNGPSMREAGGTYRIIKKTALKQILPFLSRTDEAFLPDMVTISLRKGCKVLEIPVHYRARKGESKFTGNKWKAFITGLKMLHVVFWNRIRPLNK